MVTRRFKRLYRIRRLQPTQSWLLRQRRRHLKSIFRNRFFWFSLLFLIFAGGLFYLFVFSSTFQIKEIQISGNEKVPTEVIKNLVEDRINQKLISFPTRSIFLVNINTISRNLQENFPQIFKADLKRKFPNSLTLKIEERKPLFVWCHNSGPCFYLDKEGIIFEEISETEEPFLKIRDFRFQELKLGKKVIEKEVVDFFQKTQLKLKELGILPKEFSISEDKITVQTEQGWQIYLNSKEDSESQIFNLLLVLEKEIPPEKRENLEYIDLRFGNRVYYKYK